MLLGHLYFLLFSFFCPAFYSYPLFYFCSHALLLALPYIFLLLAILLVVEGEWENELPLLGFLVQ